MCKEIYIASSSEWKQRDAAAKFSEHGVITRPVETKLHSPEPHSKCGVEIAIGKLPMFWQEYPDDLAIKQAEMAYIMAIDVNGMIPRGVGRKPSVLTTGRGVVDGITKSRATVGKLWSSMRGRGGMRGGQVIFQNICGVGKIEKARLTSILPFTDAALITLSKPLLSVLGNVNNLRRLVEWGEEQEQHVITDRSSGGIDFVKIPDTIKRVKHHMGISGMWMSLETASEKYVADDSGYDFAMIVALNGYLRGVTNSNVQRISSYIN